MARSQQPTVASWLTAVSRLAGQSLANRPVKSHRCPMVHARPRKEAATRAERAQRTRQAIVAAALRLFSQRGCDATSLQDIADELGLTKAAVYYHYNTKAELLHAVCAPLEKTMTGVIDTAAHLRTRREKIDVLANGFADAMISKHEVMRVVTTR